jgi:hypothetical protein
MTGLTSLRASSGSRSASSSIEPLRSAKRTVTCLRSPSRAAFEVRIFSARCFGVYACGESNREGVLGTAVESRPHLRQNLAPERFGSPHPEQTDSRRAQHSSQKTPSAAFSCWHRGHCILEPPSPSARMAEAFAYPSADGSRGQALVGATFSPAPLDVVGRPTAPPGSCGRVMM